MGYTACCQMMSDCSLSVTFCLVHIVKLPLALPAASLQLARFGVSTARCFVDYPFPHHERVSRHSLSALLPSPGLAALSAFEASLGYTRRRREGSSLGGTVDEGYGRRSSSSGGGSSESTCGVAARVGARSDECAPL